MNENPVSPPWNRPVKIGVAVATILFIILVLYRFQALLSSVIIGAILAYLMHPIIEFFNRRTKLERSTVTALTYLVLVIIFISIFAVTGVTLYRQASSLVSRAPDLIASIPERIDSFNTRIQEPITIGNFELPPIPIEISTDNINNLVSQLTTFIQPALGQIGSYLGSIALGTVGTLTNLIIILFVSIYIAIDAPRLSEWIGNVAEFPGYREDAERLWRDFGRIWQAYLRGQAILGLVIGLIVFVCMLILGVENALVLGLISGLMEFIPYIGPFIGAAAAVIVSFFQEAGNNTFGLTPIYFALAVLAVMTLIQQVENNFMVPRIVGDALDLNPLIVFVGALMGASLAGILGTILAAPVLATIKLIGTYAWHKMFDLDPFPNPEIIEEDSPTWVENFWEQWQLRRAGDRSEAAKPSVESPTVKSEPPDTPSQNTPPKKG